jgi:hypothetical protein
MGRTCRGSQSRVPIDLSHMNSLAPVETRSVWSFVHFFLKCHRQHCTLRTQRAVLPWVAPIRPTTPAARCSGALWGNKLLRFVYMDEAGTSAKEPVTIVVGLIVNADDQLMFAETAVNEVLGAVPQKFKKGFVFHAKEVWGSQVYREEWAMADRLALLHSMMSLSKRMKIPIALGMMRRDAQVPANVSEAAEMTPEQYHHWMSFIMCVARADKYIRDHAGLREVAAVVAEDVPPMRKFLRVVPKLLKTNPYTAKPDSLRPTLAEVAAGYMTQQSEMRASRIRQSIHFVEKEDDPILQMADACAFGFRRYFSEQKFGKDFLRSILGREIVAEDFAGPGSGAVFHYS